ncbi:hypothetical protein [Psychroserpens jangbogonensis]|uniref:hypothetical protein n=1 Tax=Psychroserpens jangbogonensis TaxID=1484460 RepID=UPI00053DF34D|nr:hypothetical protein [Psychroserpens jangbogonensis]
MKEKSLVIVISLAKSHIHYCKALIASIEHYGIENQVIVLKDGDFNIKSIENKENVTVISTKEINTYHDLKLTGLLTKINLCFLPEMGLVYDYYLHMDADSIITSSDFKAKLENLKNDFYILQGKSLDYHDEKLAKLFNNFAFKPTSFEEVQFDLKHLWYFSSGHFIMSKGLIKPIKHYLTQYRDELNTGFSKQTRFKFGDQGFFNFVVNILSFQNELEVKAVNNGIYGKEDEAKYQKLNIDAVKEKTSTEVDFIHYTGPSRKPFLKAHNFGNVLYFFNKEFYKNSWVFYTENQLRIIKYFYQFYKKRIILKKRTLLKTQV